MKRDGRVVTILLIILAAAAIAVSGVIYLNWEKEKSQSAAYMAKITKLEAEKAGFEKEIAQYKAESEGANTKLLQAEKKIRELAASLDEEKNKNQDALDSLSRELEQAKTIKADLEKKVSQSEGEINSLKSQLDKLNKEKEDLDKKLKDLSSNVQLGKIVVSPEAQTGAMEGRPAEKTLEGKILVVNKEYGFVVISLGSRDGIAEGDILSVYQKNKYIGDVVVERVDTAMASANFIDPSLKDTVKEEDKIAPKPR